MSRLSTTSLCLLMLALCAAAPLWAQDSVPAQVEAEPAAAPAPDTPPAEAPPADASAEAAAEPSIKEQISADLIDLSALNQAATDQLKWTVMRLSLQEAVKIAAANNPDVLVTSYEPMKSEADIFTARGEFDPALQASTIYSYTSATADQQIRLYGGISAVEQWNTRMAATLGGKLHTGTQYAVQFNLDKSESSYSSFIEEFGGILALSLTQPVLRGYGTKVNTVRIVQAKTARALTEEQLRMKLLATMGDVVKAYWDLVFAVEAVEVRRESLKNAERLLQINETRQKIGTAADIEVLQAKAGVAGRQSELISAQSAANDAASLLKQLMGLRDGEYLSKARIAPTDRPNPGDAGLFDFAAYDESLDKSVRLALEKRPEMAMSDLEITNAELEVMRARNDMLPQLDLVGVYGQGGRNHKLSHTFYGIREKQDFNYSIGVQGTVVINNRAARGAHLRARLTQRQAEERKKQAQLGVMTAVHLAASNVKTNQILVESNKQAVRLQEANVAAEEKRLRLGVTTSFQVLRVQEDLTTAQNMELRARIAYEKSLVDLQLAQGTLLDDLGIKFEVPGANKPVSFLESVRPRWE